MERDPSYIVDIIGAVVTATNTELKSDPASYLSTSGRNINYIYGDRDEINKQMQLLSQGIETKKTKYPLIALVMPFAETEGELLQVTIDRLIIATVTPQNMLFPERYEQFFKPVLYPILYEFLKQLTYKTVESDWLTYPFTKMDIPKVVPSEKDGLVNDFVDAIVLQDLRFKIFSPFNCN